MKAPTIMVSQVVLDSVRQLAAGEVVDLSPDIQPNYDYFTQGRRLQSTRIVQNYQRLT